MRYILLLLAVCFLVSGCAADTQMELRHSQVRGPEASVHITLR